MENNPIRIKAKIKSTLIERTEVIRTIEESISYRPLNSSSLFHIYGAGGIGKSSLKKTLMRSLQAFGHKVVEMNFSNEKNRTLDSALNNLRFQLKKEGFIFPTYDFARTVYWAKKDPEAPIENIQGLKFLEEGDYTANLIKDILADAKDLPIIGWIPKGTNYVVKYSSILRDWWHNRGKETLTQLEKMDFEDIADLLLDYWIEDVKYNISQKKCELFIAFDTFEALWEEKGKFFHNKDVDSWIYYLIHQISEIVFISLGRRPINPNRIPNIHYQEFELKAFHEEEIRAYLKEFDIVEQAIQDKVIKLTKGMPLYLSLEVPYILTNRDEYLALYESDSLNSVVKRFLRYKSPQEEHLLKILSVPSRITIEMSELLISKLSLSISSYELSEFLSDTFIEKDKEYFYIHELVREWSLQSFADEGLKAKIETILFEFFNSKLETIDDQDFEEYVLQAFTYACLSLSQLDLYEWYFNHFIPKIKYHVSKSRFVNLMMRYIRTIEEKTGGEYHLAHAYYVLGSHYLSSSKLHWNDAKHCCNKAKEILNTLVDENIINEIYILLNFELKKQEAIIHRLFDEIEDAHKCYQQLLSFIDLFRNDTIDEKMLFDYELLEIANYYLLDDDTEQAEKIFKRINVEDCDDIGIMMALGTYYKQSENYFEAERILNITLETIKGISNTVEQNLFLREFSYLFGSVYENSKQWDKAIEWYEEGLKHVDQDSSEHSFKYHDGIAFVYRAKENFESSLTHFQELLTKKMQYYPEDHEEIWMTKSQIAYTKIMAMKPINIKSSEVNSLKIAIEKLISLQCRYPFMNKFLQMYLSLSDLEWNVLFEEGNYKKACLYLVNLIARLKAYYKEDTRKIMEITLTLGKLYTWRGADFYHRAEDCLLKALEWNRLNAPESAEYTNCLNELKNLYLHTNNKSGMAKLMNTQRQ